MYVRHLPGFPRRDGICTAESSVIRSTAMSTNDFLHRQLRSSRGGLSFDADEIGVFRTNGGPRLSMSGVENRNVVRVRVAPRHRNVYSRERLFFAACGLFLVAIGGSHPAASPFISAP